MVDLIHIDKLKIFNKCFNSEEYVFLNLNFQM